MALGMGAMSLVLVLALAGAGEGAAGTGPAVGKEVGVPCASEFFRVGEFDLGFSEEASITFEDGKMRSHLAAPDLVFDEKRHGGVFTWGDPLKIAFDWHEIAFPTRRAERTMPLPHVGRFNDDHPLKHGFKFGLDLEGVAVVADGWFHLKGHLRDDDAPPGHEIPVEVCKSFEPEEVDPAHWVFSSVEEAVEAGAENVYQMELALREASLPPGLLELGRLETLTLDLSEVTEIPKEIGRLTTLRTLRLVRGRKVERLPVELFDLTELRELIAAVGIDVLPPEIGRLGKLERLWLQNGRLSRIPDEITELENLQRLDLADNRLTVLPDLIGDMPRLRELHIRGNPFQTLPPSLTLVEEVDVEHLKKAFYMDISYSSKNPGPIDPEPFLARSDPALRRKIEDVAVQHGLREYLPAMLAVARRAIRLRPARPDDGKTLGHTRLGGVPDLPQGFALPTTSGQHWTFLAQIDLAEIAPLQDYLPREGLLSFFCEDLVHGIEDEYPLIEKVKVFHFIGDREALVRYRYPEGARFVEEGLDEDPYRGYAVEARVVVSLPHLWSDTELTGEGRRLLEMGDERRDESYEPARLALAGATEEDEYHHLINGYVFTQLESPGEQAAAARMGLPDEWMNLLSLHSEGWPGFQHSDMGVLTFCVHKKDLAIADFETIVTTMQGH